MHQMYQQFNCYSTNSLEKHFKNILLDKNPKVADFGQLAVYPFPLFGGCG